MINVRPRRKTKPHPPAWKNPAVWISLAMFGVTSAISSGVIPAARIMLATWAIAVLGPAGALLFPGVRKPVEPKDDDDDATARKEIPGGYQGAKKQLPEDSE